MSDRCVLASVPLHPSTVAAHHALLTTLLHCAPFPTAELRTRSACWPTTEMRNQVGSNKTFDVPRQDNCHVTAVLTPAATRRRSTHWLRVLGVADGVLLLAHVAEADADWPRWARVLRAVARAMRAHAPQRTVPVLLALVRYFSTRETAWRQLKQAAGSAVSSNATRPSRLARLRSDIVCCLSAHCSVSAVRPRRRTWCRSRPAR